MTDTVLSSVEDASISRQALHRASGGELSLALALGFFDESMDSEEIEGATYTVAGFVANNNTSACLELNWRELLIKYNLDYFKASELSAGEGQFRKYRDNPDCPRWTPFSKREKDKFNEIKIAFTDVIEGFSPYINAVGAVVVLPDYERILLDYQPAAQVLSAHPYYLAAETVMMEAGLIVTLENHRNRSDRQLDLRPIFDSHEDHSGKFKGIFDNFRRNNPLASRHLLPPHYEDDKQYLSLQVADNIAFEIRKYVISTLGKGMPVRKSLERIKKAFVRVYRLDYYALKLIVDANITDPNGPSVLQPLSYTLEDIMQPYLH